MKNVINIMPNEIMIQGNRNLRSIFPRMKRKFFEFIRIVSTLQLPLKAGMMIIFFLFSNGVFAINNGITMKPEIYLITNGKGKASFSNHLANSDPKNSYTVPFILRHNLIIIKATVGDKTGLLLLDTGTDQLILNQNHFRGRPGRGFVSGVYGDMVNPQRKQLKVKIGQVPVHSQYAYITDLEHLEASLKIDLLGICGVDFLQKFQWVIHYHQRFIEFYLMDKLGETIDGTPFIPPSETLHLEKESGLLSVQAYIGGQAMNLALDTGTSRMMLDKKSKSSIGDQNGILESLDHQSDAVGINGSRNILASYALYDLTIGAISPPPLQVSFLSLRSINKDRYLKLDGIFNPLFMGHGTIGINWQKKHLYVWETPSEPEYLYTEKMDLLAKVP